MFKLSLILQQKSENELILRLPVGFRLLFIIILAFLVSSMITSGGISAGSLVLAILSILAGLYKEQWRFLKKERIIEHQSGLLFPYITKRVSFDEVDHLILSYSANPRPIRKRSLGDSFDESVDRHAKHGSITSFGFKNSSGKASTIEIRKSRSTTALEDNVQKIADFCEIPVKIQE